MISKGFVAVFSRPLDQEKISGLVRSWLERFETVEQVVPQRGEGDYTLQVKDETEIMWEEVMQFRVLLGTEFAWLYLTQNRYAIETSGLPTDGISLCLEVLLELPDVIEIVGNHEERRLDELEKAGLL